LRKRCLGLGNARLAGALVGQQELGAGPALVFFTHQVGDGYAHVIEEHFVDFVVAFQGDDGPHGDAWRRHIDQQEGNAALLLGLRVSAHQAENHVGVLTEGGPGFLAVDHVVVAIQHGAGLQAGQVGTGSRLGVTLAPPVFPGENARQVPGFLRLTAEFHDHRGDHVDPERDQPRRTERGALLLEDVSLHHAPASTTLLYRPVGGVPAAPAQHPLPAQVVCLVEMLAEANFLQQCRQVRLC